MLFLVLSLVSSRLLIVSGTQEFFVFVQEMCVCVWWYFFLKIVADVQLQKECVYKIASAVQRGATHTQSLGSLMTDRNEADSD